jgi:hypothetical protein
MGIPPIIPDELAGALSDNLDNADPLAHAAAKKGSDIGKKLGLSTPDAGKLGGLAGVIVQGILTAFSAIITLVLQLN